MATKRRPLGGRSARPRGGRARALVGPDAYVFDALARVAPTHYYDVMERLEKRLRTGSR
jgi:hypothetical protein